MRFLSRSFFCANPSQPRRRTKYNKKLMNNTLWLKDILSTKQLNKKHLETIFEKAKEMEDILSWKKDGSDI
jgi:hypothetical protein